MNKERMQGVRDFIAGLAPEQVYMEQWCLPRAEVGSEEVYRTINAHRALSKHDYCDTAACIAGWTTILFKDEAKEMLRRNTHLGFSELAAIILELNWDQSCELFTPDIDDSDKLNNQELVVAVLENMLVYGKPEWVVVAKQLGIELEATNWNADNGDD